MSFAVIEGGIKARKQGFGRLDVREDGLCVGGNEVGCANSNSAHAKAIMREGVGQGSCIKGKVTTAINNGFGFVDVEVVKLKCVGKV